VLLIGIETLQIADMLPSKTMPEVNTKKKPMCALKQKAVKVGMVPPKKKVRASSGISPASSFQILDTKR
jgi:hypothetical protein